MKVFDMTELKSFAEESYKFKHFESESELLECLGADDLVNITPLLFLECRTDLRKDWLPSYDEAYIQIYGEGCQDTIPIDPVYDCDRNPKFSDPIRYSDWIDKEISEKYKMIENLSDDEFTYTCQECYQRLDWLGVLIGIDVWKTNNRTDETESFSLLTKSYLYQGSYLDDCRSYSYKDLSKADIREISGRFNGDNTIYHVCGEMSYPNIFYKINSLFYDMYNKECTKEHGYNNNFDFRLD